MLPGQLGRHPYARAANILEMSYIVDPFLFNVLTIAFFLGIRIVSKSPMLIAKSLRSGSSENSGHPVSFWRVEAYQPVRRAVEREGVKRFFDIGPCKDRS